MSNFISITLTFIFTHHATIIVITYAFVITIIIVAFLLIIALLNISELLIIPALVKMVNFAINLAFIYN